MIIPGLCSVSFRGKTIEEIIEKCSSLNVPAIEWGGDIHVPHGEMRTAEKVRKRCDEKGILCPSYGSYYRAGESEQEGLSLDSVVETALTLGCRTVRIWAGNRSPKEADSSYYASVAQDIHRGASLAEKRGLTLSLEYHEKTLTESPGSLERLDELAAHPNVRYYWQPPHGYSDEQCEKSLEALGEKLSNLHVFHWHRTHPSGENGFDRQPLREGADRWRRFFQKAEEILSSKSNSAAGRSEGFAFLEFFRNDSVLQFEEDWKTLADLLRAREKRDVRKKRHCF